MGTKLSEVLGIRPEDLKDYCIYLTDDGGECGDVFDEDLAIFERRIVHGKGEVKTKYTLEFGRINRDSQFAEWMYFGVFKNRGVHADRYGYVTQEFDIEKFVSNRYLLSPSSVAGIKPGPNDISLLDSIELAPHGDEENDMSSSAPLSWWERGTLIYGALDELGIDLACSESITEEGDAFPYERYISRALQEYTGMEKVENTFGPSWRYSGPCPDTFLINSIVEHFFNKGDERLEKVAWNTFFATRHTYGSYLRQVMRERGWKPYAPSVFTRYWNKTQIETDRLRLMPFDVYNVSDTYEWKTTKHIGENDREPSPSFKSLSLLSYGNISWRIVNKEDERLMGAICLRREGSNGSLDYIYDLEVYLLEEYRNNGYEKEAVDAALNCLREGKVRVFSERDYQGIFEEYTPDIGLVKAYIDPDDLELLEAAEFAGMEKDGAKTECSFDGNGYSYKKKAVYSFRPICCKRNDLA